MDSAFGIDHGDVSKGLPRAVKNGQGGMVGALMRMKNSAGKSASKLSGMKAYSESHAGSLKYLKDSEIKRGKSIKPVVEDAKFHAKHNTAYKSREIRARLLNEDSAARRAGFKTGKSSGLDRGYRGRVNPMKELP